MTPEAIVAVTSISLTGVVVNTPAFRSAIKTPIMRSAAAGLLAAILSVGGMLIERLVLNAR